LLRKSLLDKEKSPDNIFDWSTAKIREYKLELIEEEDSENLSDYCRDSKSNQVFSVDDHIRSYSMKPKRGQLWFSMTKGKIYNSDNL
jgi:hypothetical protein